MSVAAEPATIDAMIYAIADAGWTYQLESNDVFEREDRHITVNHRATVEDEEGRVVITVELSAHQALEKAIQGMWRIRGGSCGESEVALDPAR